MKICRFNDNRLGLVEGDQVIDVTEALSVLPQLSWPYPHGDALIRHLKAVIVEAGKAAGKNERHDLAAVKLLSPVANPSKVIAAPLNYGKHVAEAGADVQLHQHTHSLDFEGYATPIDKLGLFLKSSTSVVGAGEGVEIAFSDRRNDHEIELAVVIGTEAKDIPEDKAFDCVAGYCIGLDMTVRGTEERSFRKSLDTYTVLGPWLATPDEISDPSNLDFWIKVNGETKQASNTDDLTMGLKRLISLASKWYRLYPGDVILTGTPDGVAPVKGGDMMECWFQDIGTMTVAVR
jgi:2-keto-4-pentenoate hydratase/2-oxohepta-3-ene-1,7-dioic acid hydratase in catechol pathway